jgi:hypothetical protein
MKFKEFYHINNSSSFTAKNDFQNIWIINLKLLVNLFIDPLINLIKWKIMKFSSSLLGKLTSEFGQRSYCSFSK